jgi:pectin methylesterase-like acyl-CoA thioesterase
MNNKIYKCRWFYSLLMVAAATGFGYFSIAPTNAVALSGTLGSSYLLVVGKTANDGTGRTNLGVPDFTTIGEALKVIPKVYSTAGGCKARYVIRVLPGVYKERVTMKRCVDIEGSGELATRITAPGGGGRRGTPRPPRSGVPTRRS